MKRTPTLLLAALAALPCAAQRHTVVIDPARGGSEYGARIDGNTYEKQATLDLANRLRALLVARDFNVLLTRENDSLVTNEQRAAIANQNKPIACILLHATASGTGIHLWTSSLNAAPVGSTAVLWDEAQSPFVDRSQRMTAEFATAFSRSKIPVSSGHTWIRPLDNMQCPALAIEVAPRDSDTPASDRDYQNRIAGAIANELLFWRGHTDVMQSITNPPPPPAPASPAPAPTTPKPADTIKLGSRLGDTPTSPTAAPKPRRTTPAATDGTVAPQAAPKPKPKPVAPQPTAQEPPAQ